MQRYESYKPSSVEWLGEIPSHWSLIALKRIARLKSGEAITSADINGGEYPVFGGNGKRGYLSKYTHEGDFALIGRQGALCGNINYASGKFWASEHAIVVMLVREASTKWLGELLRVMNLNQYSIAAAQPGLSAETIANLKIPVPPIAEQKKIAKFLDQKTTEIDAAIAKKELLIDLLQEQKGILVNHAATQGLNPNVPMRSGLEWIEQAPAHWENFPLKHVSTVQSGLTLGKSYPPSKGVKSYPYLRVANVQDGFLDLTKITQVNLPVREAKNYFLQTGDILVTEGGDIDKLGRGNCWYGEIDECLHQNHVFAVRMTRKVLPEYVSLITGVAYARRYFTTTANKTTNLASTNKTKLGNLPLFVPPEEEQKEILAYCNDIKAKFEALTKNVVKEIAALKEMKSVLITESVTGKIKI